MSAILITVNLQGVLGGRVKHTDTYKNAVKISDSEYMVKTITHSDRLVCPCQRVTRISEDVVESWAFGSCPEWLEDKKWKYMTPHQKIAQFVNRFDEGYGVNFHYLD